MDRFRGLDAAALGHVTIHSSDRGVLKPVDAVDLICKLSQLWIITQAYATYSNLLHFTLYLYFTIHAGGANVSFNLCTVKFICCGFPRDCCGSAPGDCCGFPCDCCGFLA